jgi:hypothetical protein
MALKTTKLEGKTLTVSIDIEDTLRDSSTGKTEIVASSNGPIKTEIIIDGRPVWVVVSAFVKKKDKTDKFEKMAKEVVS